MMTGISAYGLTEHGEGLTAALQDLIVWGTDLLEHTDAEIHGDERRLEKLLETFRLPAP